MGLFGKIKRAAQKTRSGIVAIPQHPRKTLATVTRTARHTIEHPTRSLLAVNREASHAVYRARDNIILPAAPYVTGAVATYFGGPTAGMAAFGSTNQAIAMYKGRKGRQEDGSFIDEYGVLTEPATQHVTQQQPTQPVTDGDSQIIILGIVVVVVVVGAFIILRK